MPPSVLVFVFLSIAQILESAYFLEGVRPVVPNRAAAAHKGAVN
jgi:hypothetical protein